MDRNTHNDRMFSFYYGNYHQSAANVSLNGNFFANNNLEPSLNPRQLFWIKKRNVRRDALDALMKSNGANYIYESRHRHAMKRERASSGRFLTKEEIQEKKRRNQINFEEKDDFQNKTQM